MAGSAADPTHMVPMGAYSLFRSFFWVMALEAGGPGRYIPAAGIHVAIPMELGSRVAIGTEHTFLIMHIRYSPILTGKLGIHPPSMAESTGLGFILPDELVPVHQSEVHSTDDGAFHMTIPAGSVAGSAGLLEHLRIKNPGFFFGKPPADCFHASRGVMKGKFVGFGNAFVTGSAGGRIVRGPFHQAGMRFGFVQPLSVTLMTNYTSVF